MTLALSRGAPELAGERRLCGGGCVLVVEVDFVEVEVGAVEHAWSTLVSMPTSK